MDPEIKALYDQANNLYAQAKAILDEYKGKEMPAEKAQQVDALLDQVETKTTEAKRLERANGLQKTFTQPATNIPLNGGKTAEQKSAEDRERVQRYMKGDLPEIERKDLATAPNGAGGYLVADTQLKVMVELQAASNAVRRIANVLPPIPGGAAVAPSEDSELDDAEWTTEVGTGSDDTKEPFGGRKLIPHPIAKRAKVSRTLLRAATLLDVEKFVFGRLERKFDKAEENGFINGDGNGKPLGMLKSGITAVTTSGSNALAGDDIINWAYSLPAAYQKNAKILCNGAFIRKVRLLKGTDNNYLWQPGLAAGSPAKILDWQYEISDSYPSGLTNDAYDDNALVATIGDFYYFWIVDSLNLSIQRLEELYAEKNQVGFIGRKETDGQVVAVDAFRNLKIKA